MKKILILALMCSLLLSGCAGGTEKGDIEKIKNENTSEENTASDNKFGYELKYYDISGLGISLPYPKGWWYGMKYNGTFAIEAPSDDPYFPGQEFYYHIAGEKWEEPYVLRDVYSTLYGFISDEIYDIDNISYKYTRNSPKTITDWVNYGDMETGTDKGAMFYENGLEPERLSDIDYILTETVAFKTPCSLNTACSREKTEKAGEFERLLISSIKKKEKTAILMKKVSCGSLSFKLPREFEKVNSKEGTPAGLYKADESSGQFNGISLGIYMDDEICSAEKLESDYMNISLVNSCGGKDSYGTGIYSEGNSIDITGAKNVNHEKASIILSRTVSDEIYYDGLSLTQDIYQIKDDKEVYVVILTYIDDSDEAGEIADSLRKSLILQ